MVLGHQHLRHHWVLYALADLISDEFSVVLIGLAGHHDVEQDNPRLLQADLPAMGRAARASVRSQHDDIVAAWQAVIRKADPSNQNKTGRSPVRLAGV